VRAVKGSRIDSDGAPAGPPAAVGFSDEDLVWWSEGERIEALEPVDVDEAALWERSGSHRIAARDPIRGAVSRVAKRRRFLGLACAGALLAGALLLNAGLSGQAHEAPLSTPIAADRGAGMPSLAGRPAAAAAEPVPAADPAPAELAARPATPARHRARAKAKKTAAPAVARHGASKSRPPRSRPQ